ncbi:beta-1,3-glucanase family protein [Streptomyces sp. NPDC058251]|uniref:beta-1,3-glucanase family protein n=1 Tax=Streptomyces sp. NPDC058251 TaxID=3346404 RepID=UPI0036E41003
MTSRRRFLSYTAAGAAALSTPIWGVVLSGRAQADSATCSLALVNKSASTTVYAYLAGQDPNYQPYGRPQPGFVNADGTWYHLPTVSSTNTPLAVDPSIPLSAPNGAPKMVSIPHMIGARVWFSLGTKLVFGVNPPDPAHDQPCPGLVQPDPLNENDANYTDSYTFCEFTFNDSELYANISYVDLIAAPISVVLEGSAGTQTVPGFASGTLKNIANGLAAQHAADGKPWDELVTKGPDGSSVLRINAPHFDKFAFGNYYDAYVNQVWDYYTTHTLTVDLDGNTYTGSVQNGVFTFPGLDIKNMPFTKPATKDIFGCNSGPLLNLGPDDRSAVAARLGAAFNRGTLLLPGGNNQPNGVPTTSYYPPATTINHYARLIHAYTNVGYGFAYDDVVPAGQAPVDGHVQDSGPTKITLAVGNAQ